MNNFIEFLLNLWADVAQMDVTGRTGLNQEQRSISPACGELRVVKLAGVGLDIMFSGARAWRILFKTI